MGRTPTEPGPLLRFWYDVPWDPIRLSGDSCDTPKNPPFPYPDNRISRHSHALQYENHPTRSDGTTSVRSADQTLSSQYGYGASTSNNTGHREIQDTTPTPPTEASFGNEICQPSKVQSIESSPSFYYDCEEALAEGGESVGLPKISEGLSLGRNRSLEPDTRSQDPIHPAVRSFSSNLPRLVYMRVASLTNPGHQVAVPSRTEVGSTPLPAATPFTRDIQIVGADREYIFALALLDTGCQTGNWISRRLVERLRWQRKISQDYAPPNLTDAGGHPVVACGIISLQWKWSPQGTRVHDCKFFIFRESPYLDVVFGVDYIVSEGLLTINEKAMLTMTAHNKATSGTPYQEHIVTLRIHSLTRK